MLIVEKMHNRAKVFRIFRIEHMLVSTSEIWSPAQRDHIVPLVLRVASLKRWGVTDEYCAVWIRHMISRFSDRCGQDSFFRCTSHEAIYLLQIITFLLFFLRFPGLDSLLHNYRLKFKLLKTHKNKSAIWPITLHLSFKIDLHQMGIMLITQFFSKTSGS